MQVLCPLSIGDYTFPTPIFLAPLAGLTNRAFRELCYGYGAGSLACCPMLSASALAHRSSYAKTLSLCDWQGEVSPRAAQIFGADPTVMGEAARLLQGLGVELLELNLGCQKPKILQLGAGAALLREPKQAIAVISQVVANVTIPVTVKMRLGYADSQAALQLAPLLTDLGVSALTIHARTALGGFTSTPDWKSVRTIVSQTKLPVIANGSLCTVTDCRQVLAYTGARGVMLGRQALSTPWIFRSLKRELAAQEEHSKSPISKEHKVNQTAPEQELRLCMHRHIALAQRYSHTNALEESTCRPPRSASDELSIIRSLRRHFSYYLMAQQGELRGPSALFRQRLMQAETFSRLQEILGE